MTCDYGGLNGITLTILDPKTKKPLKGWLISADGQSVKIDEDGKVQSRKPRRAQRQASE